MSPINARRWRVCSLCVRVVDTDALVANLHAIGRLHRFGCVAHTAIIDETVASKAARLHIMYHRQLFDASETLENVANLRLGRTNVQAKHTDHF